MLIFLSALTIYNNKCWYFVWLISFEKLDDIWTSIASVPDHSLYTMFLIFGIKKTMFDRIGVCLFNIKTIVQTAKKAASP